MRRSVSPLLLSQVSRDWLYAVATLNDESIRNRVVDVVNGGIRRCMKDFAVEIDEIARPPEEPWERAFVLLATGALPSGASDQVYRRRLAAEPVEVVVGSLDLSEVRNDWIEAICTLRNQPIRVFLSELVESHFQRLQGYYAADIWHLARKYGLSFDECFQRLARQEKPPYGEPVERAWVLRSEVLDVHIEVQEIKGESK